MNARESCSALSLSLGEPLFATASQASGYVLLEQPRPWGAKALLESRLDPGIGRELEGRATELGLKALLVARPGRVGRGPRKAFLGFSGEEGPFLEELELSDPRELLATDLDRLARGERPGAGRLLAEPLYLVCRNGARDPCCARHGRAIARALSSSLGSRLWECSHVGGHRFAGNLVRLPEGLWLGRVGGRTAEAVVGSLERGRLPLEHFRGRSCFAPAVQAAEQYLRERLGLRALDPPLLLGERPLDEGCVELRLRAGGAEHAVVVRAGEASPARPISCGDEQGERPQTWSLVRLGPA